MSLSPKIKTEGVQSCKLVLVVLASLALHARPMVGLMCNTKPCQAP